MLSSGYSLKKNGLRQSRYGSDKLKSKVFHNTHEGFVLLSQWLSQHDVQQLHACMEVTGIYWQGLAEYLADAGHRVSVVNPAQISAYAKSTLQRGKTDIQDARLIARFCERECPDAWHPEPLEQRQLLLLVRQLQHVNDCLFAERKIGFKLPHWLFRPASSSSLSALKKKAGHLRSGLKII